MGCHHSVSCFKVVISWIAPFSQVSKSEMLKNLPSPTIFFKILLENQGKAGFTFYSQLKTEEKTPEEVGLEDAVCISSNPMALRSGLTVGSVRCRGLNWGGGIGGIFPFLEVFQTFSWNSWRK